MQNTISNQTGSDYGRTGHLEKRFDAFERALVDYGRTGHLENDDRHFVVNYFDYGRTGHLETAFRFW